LKSDERAGKKDTNAGFSKSGMGNAASQDDDAYGMKNGQEEAVDIFNPYVCHRDDLPKLHALGES
jgi:hypothetical protein